MKPQIAFIVLTSILLTACAVQTPAPSSTLPPAALTASQTQPPTATAIPSPTVSPEMIALQEEIAKTEKLTFNTQTGELEYNWQIYKGLKYDDAEKMWNLTLSDGTVVELAPDEVSISDEDGFSAPGYSYDEEKGWGVEVVKDYPICSISEFQKCVFPEEDFFNGNFQRWHETMPHQFVEGQVDLRPWTQETGSRGLLYQDKTIKRARGAVSVWVDPAEGITNSEGYDNRVIPFQLPDPSDPYNPEKNIYVTGVSLMNYVKNGVLGKPLMGGDIKYLSDVLQNRTNQLLIVPGFTYPNTAVVIPLVKKTWETLGAEKMQSIITRVAAGDPTALRELNGMPVLLLVGDTTDW